MYFFKEVFECIEIVKIPMSVSFVSKNIKNRLL